MAREQFSRSEGIYDSGALARARAELVGCGAVGGWTALLAAKAGWGSLTVWDHDSVAVENVGPQPYPISTVGQRKVEALRAVIADWSGYHCRVETRAERYTGARTSGRLGAPVVVSAVDSMLARGVVFEAARESGAEWFLDARMGAEQLEIYCIQLCDASRVADYRRTLFSDADAVAVPCTRKATSFCGAIIGGYMARLMLQIALGVRVPWHVSGDLTEWATGVVGK